MTYDVEREGGGGTFTQPSQNQFMDTFLEPNSVHAYRVCASYHDADERLCSPWQGARTLPPEAPARPPPKEVTVSIGKYESTRTSVTVHFSAVRRYDHLNVRFGEQNGGVRQYGIPFAVGGTWTAIDLRPGAIYVVSIQGCDEKLLGSTCSAWHQAEVQTAGITDANCAIYTEKALQQAAENVQMGCGLAGPRWSTIRNDHWQWCKNVADDGSTVGEQIERINALARCRPCKEYAKQAGAQARENEQYKCGGSGPRWSASVENHLQWCMSMPASDRLGQNLPLRAQVPDPAAGELRERSRVLVKCKLPEYHKAPVRPF